MATESSHTGAPCVHCHHQNPSQLEAMQAAPICPCQIPKPPLVCNLHYHSLGAIICHLPIRESCRQEPVEPNGSNRVACYAWSIAHKKFTKPMCPQGHVVQLILLLQLPLSSTAQQCKGPWLHVGTFTLPEQKAAAQGREADGDSRSRFSIKSATS
jgi:hypothetical protein